MVDGSHGVQDKQAEYQSVGCRVCCRVCYPAGRREGYQVGWQGQAVHRITEHTAETVTRMGLE